jgi:hypothetical protein
MRLKKPPISLKIQAMSGFFGFVNTGILGKRIMQRVGTTNRQRLEKSKIASSRWPTDKLCLLNLNRCAFDLLRTSVDRPHFAKKSCTSVGGIEGFEAPLKD